MTNQKPEEQKPITPQQAAELVKRWEETNSLKTSAYYRLKQLATGSY